ncbi:hypothetical protein IFM89_019352 [Coptis chinensis]|uniref:F-box domain-containing protein n=1 Tax=Coptis chinensis TaxID=261450 RepID=A0A835I3P1_9MAGN|nr:hypothetical protein IFM89_019352 [Coptis chinensis]
MGDRERDRDRRRGRTRRSRTPERNRSRHTRSPDRKFKKSSKYRSRSRSIDHHSRRRRSPLPRKHRDEKEQQNKKEVFSKLPVDIVFDIFARLPLNTISECKWVSKAWYDLVLHPRFADIYFARSRTSLPCVVFFSRYLPSYLIDPISLGNYETSATAHNLKLKGFKENFRIKCGWVCFEVVGTVNGLICYCPESCDYEPVPYYICNPITRDYLMPPTSLKKDIVPIGSGFGFD